jgi:hypothetical protein
VHSTMASQPVHGQSMHMKALLGLACPSYSRFGCVLSCGQECPATLHQDQLCKLLAHVVQLAVAARSGLLVPACPLPEPCELTPALPVVISVRHVQPAHCGHASIDACRHCGNVGGRAGMGMGRWREGWRHSCGVRPLKAHVRTSNVDLQLCKGTIRTGC